jgi:hypothetical protein
MTSDSGAKRLAAYSFLVVFANDGTISSKELEMLERIAIEDNVIDDAEKQVLKTIFSRVSHESVSPEVWQNVEEFRAKYGI